MSPDSVKTTRRITGSNSCTSGWTQRGNGGLAGSAAGKHGFIRELISEHKHSNVYTKKEPCQIRSGLRMFLFRLYFGSALL